MSAWTCECFWPTAQDCREGRRTFEVFSVNWQASPWMKPHFQWQKLQRKNWNWFWWNWSLVEAYILTTSPSSVQHWLRLENPRINQSWRLPVTILHDYILPANMDMRDLWHCETSRRLRRREDTIRYNISFPGWLLWDGFPSENSWR